MKQSCQRSRVYRATCAHFPATRRPAQGTCMLRLQFSLTNLEQKEVKVLCQLPECKAGLSLFLAHPKFLHAGNDGTSSISGNQDWGRLERRHSSISGSQDWGRLEEACLSRETGFSSSDAQTRGMGSPVGRAGVSTNQATFHLRHPPRCNVTPAPSTPPPIPRPTLQLHYE